MATSVDVVIGTVWTSWGVKVCKQMQHCTKPGISFGGGGGRHHTSLKTFCPPLIGDFKVPIFETVAFKITATQYLHSTSKQISSRLCIPYMMRGALVTQSVSVGIASWPNCSAKTPLYGALVCAIQSLPPPPPPKYSLTSVLPPLRYFLKETMETIYHSILVHGTARQYM